MKTDEISKTVEETLNYCLFTKEEVEGSPVGESPESTIVAEGICLKIGLHSGRVAEKKEIIKELLDFMPQEFHKNGGGGWSFLNLCEDKNGNQWTGLHDIMERLIMLGMAVGMASYLVPRDLWYALPGGMPYVVFDTCS